MENEPLPDAVVDPLPKHNLPPVGPSGLRGDVDRGPDGKARKKVPKLSSVLGPTLEVMRWVWSHPEGEDTTHQQRNVRQWMNDNKGAFHAKLMEMETREAEAREKRREAQRAAKVAAQGPVVARDLGAERAEELIAQLLREFQDGVK